MKYYRLIARRLWNLESFSWIILIQYHCPQYRSSAYDSWNDETSECCPKKATPLSLFLDKSLQWWLHTQSYAGKCGCFGWRQEDYSPSCNTKNRISLWRCNGQAVAGILNGPDEMLISGRCIHMILWSLFRVGEVYVSNTPQLRFRTVKCVPLQKVP